MNSYVVVATFRESVTQDEIRAQIPAERVQAKLLDEYGLIGVIKVAMPKWTASIEAFGRDDQSAFETIHSLPLAKLWDFELFPITPLAGANV